MKKIIGICLTLIIILTGCSNAKKGIDDTAKQTANNTTKQVENDTSIDNASLGKNQQSQSENTSHNITDINRNENFTLLENIDTTKSQFTKGYYNYKGTINNNILIQMSIYSSDKGIVGTYFYEEHRVEIKLQGKTGENNIVLLESDETGKNTGVFKGTMYAIDKIQGTWISEDGKRIYPFTLSLKNGFGGLEYGKRYSFAVKNKSDQDVEDFVNKIQNYVVNDNKEQLAEQVHYPINVKINGEATTIQNKDDFIKKYAEILYPEYKNTISNAFTKYLFANGEGIMFGDSGEMWINEVISTGNNSKLMITTINN